MLSHFSVHYNVSLPLRLQNVSESIIADKATAMLKQLNMAEQARKTADALSGGQRQRVAVGRALIHHPKIVFADEPTGNLDPKTSIIVMDLLTQVCETVGGAALLLVTHNPCLALKYTEKIYLLSNGDLHLLHLSQAERHKMINDCEKLTESKLISAAMGEQAT